MLTIPIQALTVRELEVDGEGNPVIKETKEAEGSEKESEEDAKKMESTPYEEAVIGVLGKERLKRDIKLVM